jgi:hypothetical protein
VKRLTILSLLCPIAALAEVMDKEFWFSAVVLRAAWGAVLGLASARWLPWGLLAVLPLLAVPLYSHLSEVADSTVRSAMVNEVGIAYLLISLASPALVAACVGVGLYMRRHYARPAR